MKQLSFSLLPLLISLSMGAATCGARAQEASITVDVAHPGHAISPTLYGLMTEEINHSYDGGLYAELIQNRSFKDDPNTPVHWSLIQDGGAQGSIALDTTEPLSQAQGVSLKLDITSDGKRVGVANEGFWGIPVKPNTRYRASVYARSDSGVGPLTVDIESNDGSAVYASATIPAVSKNWQQYTVDLKTANVPATEAARFVVSASKPGSLWLDLVSLFPPTFNNRPNGNRIDLMQKLAAMHPSFLRLPGGNYLEGGAIPERFEWKDTIGPLTDRPGHQGPWGYRSSDGFGLLEFLEWCEDLHIQPVLAVYAGYSLNHSYVNPGPDLQPYVQDALDEIEYVTGPQTSKWGAERAMDGHLAPFPLTYVEIGNEDQFDRSGSYDGRFAQFHDAIKAKYPALQLIATAHVASRAPDVVDDHYYRSAAAMERDAGHYDSTSRTGPKVFVGEWASTEGNPTPTMNAALGDAAWLTGLERNSDVVVLASYAPLLVNVNPKAHQWGTNLIGYDALSSFGSPSYYAQAMFAENRGDNVLPVQVTQPATANTSPETSSGAIGVGTWHTQAQFSNIQVVHDGQTLYERDFTTGDNEWRMDGGSWQVQNGALTQTADQAPSLATTGDPSWTDYTYTLKAQKTSGKEGFLILFHVKNRNNYVWWNIGGWGNTKTQLQVAEDGDTSPLGAPAAVTVQTGKWYDIRIDVSGAHIKCYLDGNLITEADDIEPPVPQIFAEASRDKASGDVILKVVNVSAVPITSQIVLNGTQSVSGKGVCEVITGDPGAVNSIDHPDNIIPESQAFNDASSSFSHAFPAHSVNVLRVHVK
jgi:alpha-L-arabinofuranosidase